MWRSIGSKWDMNSLEGFFTRGRLGGGDATSDFDPRISFCRSTGWTTTAIVAIINLV